MAALIPAFTAPAQAATYDTTLVSRASGTGGEAANGDSHSAAISADKRYVAFASAADNLSDQDNDAHTNVYVRDLQTGTTTYVSRGDGVEGTAANGDSSDPSISADGRHVAFVSVAANLSSEDNDTCPGWYDGYPSECSNVFVRDIATGTTTFVSRTDGTTGAAGNGSSYAASIFPDGHRVAFTSVAENLSAEDVNECTGYTESGTFPAPCLNNFVRDLQTATTTYLAPGLHHNRWAPGCAPAVSADGRHVAVETDVSLSSPDTNGASDVYVIDVQAGTTTYASRADGPDGAAGGGWCPSISADGRLVAFEAYNNIADGSGGGVMWHEVYARDVLAGTTTVVSRPSASTSEWNKYSGHPSISGDGRYVAFDTERQYLSQNGPGVYVRDLQTGLYAYVSRASGADGETGTNSQSPSISADGQMVAFESQADNLSTQDNDLYRNIYVRELAASSTEPPTAADLSVSMTASNVTPTVGDEVTYAVTVANGGPNAAGEILVGGQLPWGPSLVSATPSQGSYQSETGLWTVGSIAAGASATLQIVGKVTTAGATTVTAELTRSNQSDPDSEPLNGNPAEDDQASVTITASAPTTCATTTTTVTADADTWIRQNTPSANHGTDTVLTVASKKNANARTLVRFTLPAIPSGCQVDGAKLRLYAVSASAGRTLRAVPLAGPWTESGVTWRTKPATTGTAATARSGSGWVQWTVTGQVTGMYTGGNHGFLVRDASEGGIGAEQRFQSHETGTGQPPELIVTFGPS